jgi:nucleotide-binding universal stress UspA family protein
MGIDDELHPIGPDIKEKESTMLALDSILFPTDFSERSEYAFRLACSLARDHDARLILLHIIPPPQTVAYEAMPVLPAYPPGYRKELEEKLRGLKPPAEVQVEYRLEEGYAATEIVRIAAEIHCDMIVMGTHGRSGLGRLLLGSVAEEVLRKASCPVLTVKARMPATAEKPVPLTSTGASI